MGGLAVYAIFQNGPLWLQMAQTVMVVIVCTTLLGAILTVQKPNTVLQALLVSLFITLLIVSINIMLLNF